VCDISPSWSIAFLRDGPTPQRTYQFESALEKTLREAGRAVVEHTYNAAEPEEDHKTLPRRVRLGRRQFRRNRQTSNQLATLFGPMVLRRYFYQAVEPGERGLAPLERRLGVVARLATPALADEAAQLNAERTQAQTLSGAGAASRRALVARYAASAGGRHGAPLRAVASRRPNRPAAGTVTESGEIPW
jgi:hypothetical protein